MTKPIIKISFLCLIVLIALSTPQAIFAQQFNREQFKAKMDELFAQKDYSQIEDLARANRYHIIWYANQLLKYYISNEISGKNEASKLNLDHSKHLANLYKSLFSNDLLDKRIELFVNWSGAEKRKFLECDSLESKADTSIAEAKFSSALNLFRQALLISEQLDDETMRGECLTGIGVAHRNLHNYDEAIDTLKLALKINKKQENKYAEGNTLRELGVSTYIFKDRDQGLSYWNQALKIFQDLNETKMEGMTLGHIGVYYRGAGQPKRAMDYYHRALKIARDTKNTADEAIGLGNMANIMEQLGNYDKSEDYTKQALKIKKELNQLPYVATLLNNLGHNTQLRGDYQKSLMYFYESLKIRKQIADSVGIGQTFLNVGVTYLDLMDNDKALFYFEQALEIFKKYGITNSEALTLLNIGVIYERRGERQKALNSYQTALKLYQQRNEPVLMGLCFNNIGAIYEQLGKFRKANENFNKALTLSKQQNSPRGQMTTLNNLGQTSIEQQVYAQALEYFRKVINLAQNLKPAQKSWEAEYGIGLVYEKLGQKEQAVKWYAKAVETIELSRSKLTIENLKQSFMEDKRIVYDAIIRILLELERDDEAYDYLERSKARSLLDILSTDRINITQGISPEILEGKREIEWKLDRIQQTLPDEFSRASNEINTILIANLEDSLKKVRFEHAELLQQIKLNHPGYANLIGITEPLNLKQVQDRIIRLGSVLIEYLVSEDYTIVWIIGKNSFVHEQLDLKRADLEKMVTDLLQPFRDVKEGKIKNLANVGFDLKLSQQLHQQIFQPIEKYLQKDNHLIIVPDGILHYLPFEALVTEIEKKPFDRNIIFSRYENAHYLVEKHAISYSPSASVLDSELFSSDKKIKREGQLLAFGNPDFSKAREAVKLAKDKEDEASANYPVLVSRSSRGGCYVQLPGAEQEVRAIAEILKPSLLYIGKDAKEENFKEKSGNFSNIHLATHCILEETQPMYSRIVFAQDDDPKEDGFLHTYEVFNLNLNADLVTLGACETGLGKLSRGEGLIGLTRAFMYAGAPSMVVSLWSVDESTAELMKLFYQNLKAGMTKVEASRQAKIKLLSSRGKFTTKKEFSFAHPYLWAPFVLVGERK